MDQVFLILCTHSLGWLEERRVVKPHPLNWEGAYWVSFKLDSLWERKKEGYGWAGGGEEERQRREEKTQQRVRDSGGSSRPTFTHVRVCEDGWRRWLEPGWRLDRWRWFVCCGWQMRVDDCCWWWRMTAGNSRMTTRVRLWEGVCASDRENTRSLTSPGRSWAAPV